MANIMVLIKSPMLNSYFDNDIPAGENNPFSNMQREYSRMNSGIMYGKRGNVEAVDEVQMTFLEASSKALQKVGSASQQLDITRVVKKVENTLENIQNNLRAEGKLAPEELLYNKGNFLEDDFLTGKD